MMLATCLIVSVRLSDVPLVSVWVRMFRVTVVRWKKPKVSVNL